MNDGIDKWVKLNRPKEGREAHRIRTESSTEEYRELLEDLLLPKFR
jgi:hypothetical protein